MLRKSDPYTLWHTGLHTWQLMLDAQMVMTMRMMGMAGLWSVTPAEQSRMVSEKTEAFTDAAAASARAMARGGSPADIAAAALKPVRRKARQQRKAAGQARPQYAGKTLMRQAAAATVVLGFWASMGHAACPGASQAEMNECAAAEYQRADAELNALWSYAKPSADQMGVGAQLLDAQRKWIAYRDAACTAEAEMFRGGSIQPLVWFQCMTRLTAQRSGDLRNFSN